MSQSRRLRSILDYCRRPEAVAVQLLATALMALMPHTRAIAEWLDVDNDGYLDWSDASGNWTYGTYGTPGEDWDGDGAANWEELNAGTNPYLFDTDYDGISDGDEIHYVMPNMSWISPTNWDSNGDYISDYDEWRGFSGTPYPGGQLPNFPGATYYDYDGDGINNPEDPCPADPYNSDLDHDGIPNDQDPYFNTESDLDGDGIPNDQDAYPEDPTNNDTDNDGIPNDQDPYPSDPTNNDADNDGIPNEQDPYPYDATNGDADGDGIPNEIDPYPYDAGNLDSDGDGLPDGQDPYPNDPTNNDADGDGLLNYQDPAVHDPTNTSSINGIVWNNDAVGDEDYDGIINYNDPWPQDFYNALADWDDDGIANDSDPDPRSYENYSFVNRLYWFGAALGDVDNDGVVNYDDAWPYDPDNGANEAADTDRDGLPDAIDPAPLDAANTSATNGVAWTNAPLEDLDQDGVINFDDPYPLDYFDGSADFDGDGIDNDDDPDPLDAANISPTNGMVWNADYNHDPDGDGLANWIDPAPEDAIAGNADVDGDGLANDVDPQPWSAANYSFGNYYWYTMANDDADSDGVSNYFDPEPFAWFEDSDEDGLPNQLDPYPSDPTNQSSANNLAWPTDALADYDNDGVCNALDTYPYNRYNVDRADYDCDGLPDYQDPAPLDPTNYSPYNGQSWGAVALRDDDRDGKPNWRDPHPHIGGNIDKDGDGVLNQTDPFPYDAKNFSWINGTSWDGDVIGDMDSDGVPNWADPTSHDFDADGDGLRASQEALYHTSDQDVDCDDDGLTDYEEKILYHSDPLDAHSISRSRGWSGLYTDYQLVDHTDADHDAIPDRIEQLYGLSPGDPADAMGDLDGNGLTNLAQYQAGLALNADLSRYDSDGDGMSDIFEDYYLLSKHNFNDAVEDNDGDGVLNYEEQELVLSPVNADSLGRGGMGDLVALMEAILYPQGDAPDEDSDADGTPDWAAAALASSSSPVFSRQSPGDVDGDGMPDAWEHKYGRWKFPGIGLYLRSTDSSEDADNDELTNGQEFQTCTDPLVGDTDFDGVSDGDEDTDHDGIGNSTEFQLGTNWQNEDSDGDGYSDGQEIAEGTDPTDPASNSAIVGLRIFTRLQ